VSTGRENYGIYFLAVTVMEFRENKYALGMKNTFKKRKTFCIRRLGVLYLFLYLPVLQNL